MLLPYSPSSTRRSIFSALLMFAVLTPAVVVVLALLGARTPWLASWSLAIGVATSTLLCIWCAVYLREEPGLVRIALIWGAVLFLLLTVAFLWAAIAPSHLGPSRQMRVQADIQGIRTMLLSYHDTNRHYPSTDQGLNALVPKLMEELPKDAWGMPYVYRCPGQANPLGYDLYSAGPDRLPDTADDDWGK